LAPNLTHLPAYTPGAHANEAELFASPPTNTWREGYGHSGLRSPVAAEETSSVAGAVPFSTQPTSCSSAAFGIGPGPPAQCPTPGASK
jgi:hypothetical protein